VAVEVEGGICWLWKLRKLVAVEVEGGIWWLCKMREFRWLWALREGSDGCGKARDLAILFG
jgi:hypothetical protein